MSDFVHLHNHSDFSLLESSQSIESILQRIKDLSMDSVALTETRNLFSMISFYKLAKKYKVKPIIGCEINVENFKYLNNQKPNQSSQLILLAKNNQGYLNLMKLVSLSYLNTANSIATISKELLQKVEAVLLNKSDDATEKLLEYADTVKGVKKTRE